MHAYTPDDFKDDYFNYSYSKKGAATVPDSEWTGDLFYPKQNYLSKSIEEQNPKAYHRITYPAFLTTKDGDLMVTWRFGGSLGANMRLTRYDGSWGKSLVWNNSKGVHTAGFYGAFSIANDWLPAGTAGAKPINRRATSTTAGSIWPIARIPAASGTGTRQQVRSIAYR